LKWKLNWNWKSGIHSSSDAILDLAGRIGALGTDLIGWDKEEGHLVGIFNYVLFKTAQRNIPH